MKKKEILDLILKGAAFVPGPVGMAAKGVDALVNRDDNPDNDFDETADAILDMLTGVVATAEGLKSKDFVNNEALRLLGESIKADVRVYQALVRSLKPAA